MLVDPDISDDDGLIRRAAEGDRAAFGELYVRYARMVHGILLARVPPADAEDLVQEVFLSAMKQLRRTANGGGISRVAGRHRPQSRHRLFPRVRGTGAAGRSRRSGQRGDAAERLTPSPCST